jgi:soluble lytic murein transglycosylase-like protein
MMDDIAAVQNRIADIQSRIAALTGSTPTPPPTDASTATAPADANANFENVLAQQRARFGAVAAPEPSVESPAPGGSSGSLPPLQIGRRPYAPPASLGPLPSRTVAPQTQVQPLAPTTEEIVPIKSGRVSEYEPIIDRYAAANGVSPSLVKAVIKTESDGNPRCVSRAGAMGLMQLMPDNVREAGIDDPFDPEQNIAAGTKQLAGLLDQYHGDLDLALAGYNAGPGNVRKYGGVPPFRETQNYIRKVRAAMNESSSEL